MEPRLYVYKVFVISQMSEDRLALAPSWVMVWVADATAFDHNGHYVGVAATQQASLKRLTTAARA